MSAVWGILANMLKPDSGVVGLQGQYLNMEFDVVMTEDHTWASEVTSNPVEDGEPVCDHVQRKADTLSISGVISNASLQRWKGYFWEKLSELLTRESDVQIAFDKLRQIMDDRQPVTVYTRYRTYPDMVMTSLSIPRKREDGDAIEFTASFTHVRRVSTLLVDSEEAGINPEQSDSAETEHKSSDTKNRGKDQPVTVDIEIANKAEKTYEAGGCKVGDKCYNAQDDKNDTNA